MSVLQSPSSPTLGVRLIRAFGVLLLGYVLVMTFTVPLGPGIVDVRVSPGDDKGRQTTFALEIEGHNTHFSESIPLVFLKRGEHFVVIRDLEAVDDHHLAGRVTLDKFVPALSWDVFVNSPVDGTMSFANGFFAQGLTASTKAKSPDNDAVLDRLSQADLGFHFPFQPNIMETIRNLMLHVPMWFTMFLLMGISFAQSIRSLGTSGTAEHDMKGLGVGENRDVVWGARVVDRIPLGQIHVGRMVGRRPPAQRRIRHGHGLRRVPGAPELRAR